MLPNLSFLLNYKHEKVIKNYMRNHQVDENKALNVFGDMLRYLWISKKHMLDRKKYPQQKKYMFQLVMHEEMREIDHMWHSFILYTQDYTQFCTYYFGEYIHHLPDLAETISQTNDEFSAEMEKYLSYIYEHLGVETVKRWFAIHFNAEE